MAADRTPNDLADRLRHMALIGASSEMGDGYLTDEEVADLRAAAALLRRQGEQLDTLRAEHDRLHRELSDTRGMVVLLLDQMGGKASISDRELVALDRTREIRSYVTDSDPYTTFIEVRPLAAAVPQDPERCACGKPATGTVGGVPTCGDDR